jgi:hypothetical protein
MTRLKAQWLTALAMSGGVLGTALFWSFIAVASFSSRAQADECDGVIAELAATIKGVEVGDRVSTSPGNFDTVALRNVAADEIKLTCPLPGAHTQHQIDFTWHTAYPPPAYFDFLSDAGAIVTARPSGAIKRGALACQKQALTTDVENSELDFAGVHVKCHVSTRNGGGVAINISSSAEQLDIPRQSTSQQIATPQAVSSQKNAAKRNRK